MSEAKKRSEEKRFCVSLFGLRKRNDLPKYKTYNILENLKKCHIKWDHTKNFYVLTWICIHAYIFFFLIYWFERRKFQTYYVADRLDNESHTLYCHFDTGFFLFFSSVRYFFVYTKSHCTELIKSVSHRDQR